MSDQHFGMSMSVEWYTPPRYIRSVRNLLLSIDVDPASCAAANEYIMARTYYTVDDDGLAHDWPGQVFLNPPYGKERGKSQQEVWSHRLISQYKAEITKEAVLLVTAATSEKWFRPLWEYPICFTDHRLAFIDGTGAPQRGNTKGGAFVYLGPQLDRFYALFSPFGYIVTQYRPQHHCAACNGPVTALPTGRMPRYCDDSCKQRAYRLRTTA